MISVSEDYTSENTQRLDIDQLVALLMKLEFIQQALTDDTIGAGF